MNTEYINARALVESNPALESLVDRIKDAQRWAEDYSSSDQSPIAEYTESWGYGSELVHQVSDRVNNSRYFIPYELTSEEGDKVLAFIRGALADWSGDGREKLESFSTFQQIDVMSPDNGTLVSCVIGEEFHELPEELTRELLALPANERDAVALVADLTLDYMDTPHARASFYTVDDYTAWAWVFDFDRFIESQQENQ